MAHRTLAVEHEMEVIPAHAATLVLGGRHSCTNAENEGMYEYTSISRVKLCP